MADSVLTSVVFCDLGDTLIYTDSNNQRQRYADTLDTLQVLRERGYRLGLLSNQPTGTTVAQVHAILNSLGLDDYIEYDLITISSEIPGNIGKPDRQIFDLALQKAGHPAATNQSIFVTETASHIEAARSYGWRSILKRITGICQPIDGECVSSLSGLLNLLPALAGISGTNLHLAPPATLVDGLWAVPVDIQRITATLIFDGSASSGTGDATLEFMLGRQTGYPIFDLRQTITAAWLDGTPFPISKLTHHNFGGGAHAELRIIETVLPAGSTHTLRVTYTLGAPQASTAGTYQPSMSWSNGPRLAFNFGFTDLGAGRYLEAWIPANLIFDQFELMLTLRILNTMIAHTVITNGEVISVGTNHWQVKFPSRFTALSPLLELRASDTLAKATDAVTLPVSGANITIDTWKLVSNPTGLPTQVNNIKNYLAENENSTGPYMHENRFVSFFHVGGMEYEGGTTTGTTALRHETFHSWWARGIKPASQPDAWFDEAWTVYNVNGAFESQPFNFTDPPVTLCMRNPWVRVTDDDAYVDGYRFWKGVAALIGVNTLKALMSNLYKQRRHHPVTTTDIEEFLICHTGNVQLVNAFHLFVYGFNNPSSAPDLWLRDDPAHAGTDPWSGRFWDSPDLWIRNSDDGGTTHQSPEFGQDNWFYARVHNRGASIVHHFVVTFNVKQFAGTQFSYANDFLPCIAAVSGFNLAPNTSVLVKARWPRTLVPPAGVHACLLAAVLTKGDPPIVGRHVWEHNNLAQKNLTIIDLKPNTWFVLPFVVSNLQALATRRFQLELRRPKEYTKLEASLLHRSGATFKRVPTLILKQFDFSASSVITDADTHLDCAGVVHSQTDEREIYTAGMITSDLPELLARQFKQGFEAFFGSSLKAQIPISVRPQEQLVFGLKLKVPQETKSGETLRLDMVQRDTKSKKILGGIAVQINVL